MTAKRLLLVGVLVSVAFSISLAQTIDWSALIQAAKPAVVQIGLMRVDNVFVGGGSGAIISPDGYILTADHVVEGLLKLAADPKHRPNIKRGWEITVRVEETRFFAASVVRRDSKADVALVKIQATNLTWLGLGDSSKVTLEEPIRVLGYPIPEHGSGYIVVAGVIQGTRVKDGIACVQHSATSLPGHSGGPVINARGQIVGLDSMQVREEGAAAMGFYNLAAAVNEAKRIVPSGVLPTGPSPVQPVIIPGTGTGAAPSLVRVPGDQATLAAAIRAVAEGGEIKIAGGTYRGDVAVTKPLLLTGETGVVIEGTVRVSAARNVTLSLVEVKGAVEIRDSSAFTLDRVVVRGSPGDGVLIEGSSGVITGCTIEDARGAGVAAALGSRITVTKTTVRRSAKAGIALSLKAQAQIAENTIEGNQGDGISVVASDAGIQDNVVRNNSGCGIKADADSTIVGNATPANISGNRGGNLCGKAVRLDTEPPAIPTNLGVSPSTWTNQRITVDWTNPEDFTGVAAAWYKVGSVPTSSEDGTRSTEKPLVLDNLPEGRSTIFLWLEDRAGNKSEKNRAQVSAFVDRTPPRLSLGDPQGTLGNEGWYRSDVTVPFVATDNLAGFSPDGRLELKESRVTAGEGSAIRLRISVTDRAGNAAEVETGPFKVDKTPPTITAEVSPRPNAEGWNNSDVTVTFRCEDRVSGVARSTEPVRVTQEGRHEIRGIVEDRAGHVAHVAVHVNLDKTPPRLTASRTPAPNAFGWTNTDVTLRFEGVDDLSGVASITSDGARVTSGPLTVVIRSEGPKQSRTAICVDRAGNSSQITVGDINIDKVPPTIVARLDPQPNEHGWNTTDVTVSFFSSDALSGLSFSTEPVLVTEEGRGMRIRGEAVDKAGNRAEATAVLNIDKCAPIGRLSVNNGEPVTHFLVVTLSLSASDVGASGILHMRFSNDGFTWSLWEPFDSTKAGWDLRTHGGTAKEEEKGIYAQLLDRAGNLSAPIAARIQLAADPNPPPAPKKLWVSPDRWTNDGVFSVDWEDLIDRIPLRAAAWFKVGSPPDQPDDGTRITEKPFTVQIRDEGEIPVYVWLEDARGQKDHKNRAVAVLRHDRSPPSVTVTRTPFPNAYGWNNTDVTVRIECTDELSGVASVVAAGVRSTTGMLTIVLDREGSDQFLETVCTDKAGNSAQVTLTGVNIDKTAPVIRVRRAPEPNEHGWNNTDVSVTFICEDTLSGLISIPEPVLVSREGKEQRVQAEVMDKAGNLAGLTVLVSIDKTPPLLRGDRSPAPNANGWNNTDVTVRFDATDDLSGVALIAAGDARSTASPLTVVLASEGAGQSRTAICTDRAGNSTQVTVTGLNIDKTPPVIMARRDPEPNEYGWNNTDVTVRFICEDALSGLVSYPEPVQLSREEQEQRVQAEVMDKAGNLAELTVLVSIDKTPPLLRGDRSPAPNANGWNNTDVTVRFDATDDLSGVALIAAGDARSTASPLTVVVASEGAGQSRTAICTDRAGNSTEVTVTGLNIDKTPPVIIARRDPEPNEYGWNNTDVTVSFSGEDALSGLARCTGPVRLTQEGEDLKVEGEAWDNAENRAVVTVTVRIDKTPPTGSLTIDEAASVPPSATVALRISVDDPLSGVSEMRFSNDDGLTWSDWEKFTSSRSWDLSRPGGSAADGPRTVHAQIRDRAGNIAALTATARLFFTGVLTGHREAVTSVAASPDGRLVASGSADRTIRLWDGLTGTLLRTISGHTGEVTSVAVSPDGRLLASGSKDSTVRVWEAATGRLVHTLVGHTGGVNAVAFCPTGRFLASGSDDNTVRLWDPATGTHIRTLFGHMDDVTAVAFSFDGWFLASGSKDKTVRVWDPEGRRGDKLRWNVIFVLSGHAGEVTSVAFSRDRWLLASGSSDSTVRIWYTATGTNLRTLSGHAGGVTSVAFSLDPARRVLASASWDSTVWLWDADTGIPERTLAGHTGVVNSVAFTLGGRVLVSGARDKTVRLWGVGTARSGAILTGHAGEVYSVAFSKDGRFLASGSSDTTVRLWDVGTQSLVRILVGHTARVRSVAFSPDGRFLASGSWDKAVRLWDMATGDLVRTLAGHTDWVNSVAFSPDGRLLASGSSDKTVRLWDVTTGTLVRTLTQHGDWVRSVAFSPDGKLLASGSDDKTVRLWDVATGNPVRTLSGHTSWVSSVAFSPDGRVLASGSDDKTVRLWDVATGNPVRTLSGHTGCVFSVAFSPDGRLLTSGSQDETVRLWDVATGNLVRTFTGHTGTVWSVAFSPDGKFIASGSGDRTVWLWDVSELRSR